MSRIFNDMAFSNIELFKNVVDNTKKQSKYLAEIGKRNVSAYERIERDSGDALLSAQKDLSIKKLEERKEISLFFFILSIFHL